MATKIEWATEVWNVCTGCTKVSHGCTRCYAESMAMRFWKGRKFTDVQCHPERLMIPVRRKKPTTFFVCSMSDLFHKRVPDKFIAHVWSVFALCQQHRFIVLTKRAERMCQLVLKRKWAPLPNVILGTSAEDQPTFDERVGHLRKTPAACRMISMEPLLGPIECGDKLDGISWVILGGESGPGARPIELDWIWRAHAACKAANVPFFMKQFGSEWARNCGYEHSKGGDPSEWGYKLPREFPPLRKGINKDKGHPRGDVLRPTRLRAPLPAAHRAGTGTGSIRNDRSDARTLSRLRALVHGNRRRGNRGLERT